MDIVTTITYLQRITNVQIIPFLSEYPWYKYHIPQNLQIYLYLPNFLSKPESHKLIGKNFLVLLSNSLHIHRNSLLYQL